MQFGLQKLYSVVDSPEKIIEYIEKNMKLYPYNSGFYDAIYNPSIVYRDDNYDDYSR